MFSLYGGEWICDDINESFHQTIHGATPISSISIGFSIINHPFGDPPFMETHILMVTLFIISAKTHDSKDSLKSSNRSSQIWKTGLPSSATRQTNAKLVIIRNFPMWAKQ